jgi:hypothetical protein
MSRSRRGTATRRLGSASGVRSRRRRGDRGRSPTRTPRGSRVDRPPTATHHLPPSGRRGSSSDSCISGSAAVSAPPDRRSAPPRRRESGAPRARARAGRGPQRHDRGARTPVGADRFQWLASLASAARTQPLVRTAGQSFPSAHAADSIGPPAPRPLPRRRSAFASVPALRTHRYTRLWPTSVEWTMR